MSSDFKDIKDNKEDRAWALESKIKKEKTEEILKMQEALIRARKQLRDNTATSEIDEELAFESQKKPQLYSGKYNRYHSWLSFFNPASTNVAYKGFLGSFVNFIGKIFNFVNDNDCEALLNPKFKVSFFKALGKLIISIPGALLRVAANIVDFLEEAIFSPIKTLNNLRAAFSSLFTKPPAGKYRVGEFFRNVNKHYQILSPKKEPVYNQPTNTNELTVLTINLGCLRDFYWTFGGKKVNGEKSLNGLRRPAIRAAEMANQLIKHEKESRTNPKVKSRDVICVQEMFDPKSQAIFIEKMREEYPYIIYDIGQRRSPMVGSGLLILSRFPIVDVQFHRYHNLKGLDIVSNKGFAAAKIKKGNVVHTVYTTHTQAGMGGVPTKVLEVLAGENSNDTTGDRRAQALALMMHQHATFYQHKPLPVSVQGAKAGLEIFTGDVNQALNTSEKAFAVSLGKKSSRKSGKVKYKDQFDAMHHLKLKLPENFINLNISQAELELRIAGETFLVKHFVRNERNEIIDVKLQYFNTQNARYGTALLSEEPFSSKFTPGIRKKILLKVNQNRNLPYFPNVPDTLVLPSAYTLAKKTETIADFIMVDNKRYILIDPVYDNEGNLTAGSKIKLEDQAKIEPITHAELKLIRENKHFLEKKGLLKSEVYLKNNVTIDVVQEKYNVEGDLVSGLKVISDKKGNITSFKKLSQAELEEINKNNEIAFCKHYAAAIPVLTKVEKVYRLNKVNYKKDGTLESAKMLDINTKELRDLTKDELGEINQLFTKKSILPHVVVSDNRKIHFQLKTPQSFDLTKIKLNADGSIASAKKKVKSGLFGFFKTQEKDLSASEIVKINKHLSDNPKIGLKLMKQVDISEITIKVQKEFEVVDFEKDSSGNYSKVEVLDIDSQNGTATRLLLDQEALHKLNNAEGLSLEEARRKGLHPTKVLWDQYTFDSLHRMNPKYADAFSAERHIGSSYKDEYLADKFQNKIYQDPEFGGVATNRRLLDLSAARNTPLLKDFDNRLVTFENDKQQAETDHLGLESVFRMK